MKRVYFSNRPDDEFTLVGETDSILEFWIVNGAWQGIYDKVTKQGYPKYYPKGIMYFGDYTIEET